MIFEIEVVGSLGVNCVLLGCEKTGKGIVVDPGGDAGRILASVQRLGLSVDAIINTHGHFDHVGANARLKEATGAPILIHPADGQMLSLVSSVASMYGITGENSPPADNDLEDGMEIQFGEYSMKVIHTPGHTRGGCCLYIESEKRLISGDTLFADGIGRTDLPGGSTPQILESIRKRLFVLPDDVKVYPGHGPATTIGHEKRHNPYLS